MAEGGGEDEKDNPFSFKAFISKKETPNRPPEDSETDIFDAQVNHSQRKREKQRQILVLDDDAKPKQQKKGKVKKENPFSFKKFLSSSSGTSGSVKSQSGNASHIHYQEDDNQFRPDVGQISGDLPDFVQDHYISSSSCNYVGVGADKKSPRGLDLPDFALVGLPSEGLDIGSGNESEHNSVILHVGDNDSNELLHKAEVVDDSSMDMCGDISNSNRQSGMLPDFLSDAAIGGSHSPDRDITESSLHVDDAVDGDMDIKLQTLREENQDLKRQLAEAHSKTLSDTENIAELQRQMVAQRKKEAEETAVMEKAIHQVEQTLSSTTKRAVQAEATVSRLKQETKSLQAEVKVLHSENESLRTGDQGLSDIKERTSYVAEQLSSATDTAEKSLKQLLTGIDNLKLLSQVLKSIDKISEETSAPSTEEKNNKKTYEDT